MSGITSDSVSQRALFWRASCLMMLSDESYIRLYDEAYIRLYDDGSPWTCCVLYDESYIRLYDDGSPWTCFVLSEACLEFHRDKGLQCAFTSWLGFSAVS